eukprot:CAMPEP_0113386512 /NCGR_PEP_ID=MMETSP0013_2-20120614/8050_1 /TAXON_ID=2843 ORGANISM="Skeletonema costatum, Strain 1716" /NCGR_SAMPLE_ID=MMETSP0013_2 /ASSEMBLY_ACC=CAM_ASM_000158 /LENGTH=571 /DNA_ID=CAMNT_0000269361 /DNA_START=278 /DNA_END=1993 /DNA_ORIENTATION=- /assembly_acc=CAM_ASM_000158
MPDDNNFRIGYVADVEGHWDYFLEYVQRSNVLYWEEHEGHNTNISTTTTNNYGITFQRLKLRPNTHFVYGGDSVDKGPGDIRLCRALVDLKKQYPDHVHLLVGNRDLNKIRFSSELSDDDMERPIEDIKRPFWDSNAKSYKEHLEEVKQTHAATKSDCTLDDLNTKTERLRWMLKHTLGCPDTFEFRREEIAYLDKIYGSYPPTCETHESSPVPTVLHRTNDVDVDTTKVTDEDVVESFNYEINHSEGSLRQYLHHASIASIIGNTIFVHGAIDRLTMRFVPSKYSKFDLPTSPPPSFAEPSIDIADGMMIDDVHEWVQSLNEYLHDGLKDFESRPHWNEERTSRGGEALLAIQNRPSMWGRSVVCNSYADGGVVATDDAEEQRKQALRVAEEELNPLAFEGVASNVFDQAPADWLLAHGIKRIVVGHKPTGDCPAVLSSAYTGVEVCSVDTSFARRRDISTGEKSNRFGVNRGDAIALVEIAGSDCNYNRLEVSGTLADGTEYSNTHPHIGINEDAITGDSILGKKTVDGWWVKASVSDSYHLCRGKGRTVEYDTRSEEDVFVCHQLLKR